MGDVGIAVSANRAHGVGDLRVALRKAGNGAGATGRGFSLDVEFTVAPGFTILFGASAAGKTTILDCIAGLQSADGGRVSISNVDLFDSERQVDVPVRHRRVGYLFQTVALFPHLTGKQNIEYGLSSLPAHERVTRTGEVAKSFGISAVLDRRPLQMSGGERQRTALARALVTRPCVLLLDEPMTALDALTKSRILDDLRRWNEAHSVPILYVTHEREEVYALGERVIVLESGRIVADGTPHEVMRRPQYESVAQLAGFENVFDSEVESSHPEQGTMTCRIVGSGLTLEAPLTRVAKGTAVKLGIRAGDILVATGQPAGLSARNILSGRVTSLRQHDVTVIAEVDCGAKFIVHVTPGACQSLALQSGKPVWLVLKTYSCHVLQPAPRVR